MMEDLRPEERPVHRILSAVKPDPLPLGFREGVMRAIRNERTTTAWEWIVATALAVPGLAYLLWELGEHGGELATSAAAILGAAQGLDQTTGAAFAIDGLAIVAFMLVGIASLLVAHALLVTADARHAIAR
jgi:hypothetical protein